ncbi:MAG: N-acetylmuramoyl-L-alanine amidase [Cellvibrionaceae bacterium]|jgi:N-acetylmuramoyl-L-alanine amidase
MQKLSKNNELGWFLRRNLAVILFLLVAASGMYYLYINFNPEVGRPFSIQTGDETENTNLSEEGQSDSTNTANFGNISQQFTQSPGPLRLALVIGHKGSDSGAVCEDELQEVQVNEAIALKVQTLLEASGIPITLFSEFDERINNFSSTALVSLHSDSCKPLDASFSGYKTTVNTSPQSELLKICIEDNYANVTGLVRHEATITDDMIYYHAFRNVSASSPALLLEMGFLFNDRDLLTTRSDTAAQGIANGILCFIQSQ